jgi:hypothetical protein
VYSFLECRSLPGEAEVLIAKWPRQANIDSWMTGMRFSAKVEEPVTCRLHQDYRGRLLSVFNDEILLMRTDLLALLRKAGVDNLDAYTAQVVSAEGAIVSEDYKAINVVGLIAGADLASSNWASSGERVISVDFDSVVLRKDLPRGPKLFRLAECVTGLVVHDDVRRVVEGAGGFPDLLFVAPDEWIG